MLFIGQQSVVIRMLYIAGILQYNSRRSGLLLVRQQKYLRVLLIQLCPSRMAKNGGGGQVWEDAGGRRRQALASYSMHPPHFFEPVIYTTHCEIEV